MDAGEPLRGVAMPAQRGRTRQPQHQRRVQRVVVARPDLKGAAVGQVLQGPVKHVLLENSSRPLDHKLALIV